MHGRFIYVHTLEGLYGHNVSYNVPKIFDNVTLVHDAKFTCVMHLNIKKVMLLITQTFLHLVRWFQPA